MSLIRERIVVDGADAGVRLDRWLTEHLHDQDYEVSRSQIQQWIKAGFVRSDHTVKPSDLVAAERWYELDVPDPAPVNLVGDDIPFTLVHEDGDVVVVEKPRGIVVHPAAGHDRGTLVNGLVARGIALSRLGGSLRPGVVHRIDKDTSGLLMFAKTDRAYLNLANQLKEHTVERVYRAIVHGQLVHDDGVVDAPIGRDPRNRQRMAVVETGKRAVTHFHVLERYREYSLVELRLETGRTHQIRVHMNFIEHPLAGDPVYGRRHTLDIAGQALHAMVLGFTHPATGEHMRFEAALPADMGRLVQLLQSEII